MTVPKHKRRTIMIDGMKYHWTPGRKPDGWIVIQHSSGRGAYLIIDLFATKETIFPLMTPADVEAAIRFALSAGWKPGEQGQNLRLGFQQFARPGDRFVLLAE